MKAVAKLPGNNDTKNTSTSGTSAYFSRNTST